MVLVRYYIIISCEGLPLILLLKTPVTDRGGMSSLPHLRRVPIPSLFDCGWALSRGHLAVMAQALITILIEYHRY
jgi:hypothetical protein